jgi:hypothetical protein
MFSRANWAIVGLNPESLEKFRMILLDPSVLFKSSQLVQSVNSKFDQVNSIGINPFDNPRKDEGRELEKKLSSNDLGTIHQAIHNDDNVNLMVETYKNFFGSNEVAFRIHPDLPWYGMWFVLNTSEDVSDVASIKEHLAYTKISRPYKYAVKEDKTLIDSSAQGHVELIRKQFPVFLDFNSGRVFIENTSEEVIIEVLAALTKLGVETFPLMWKFVEGDWVTKFLNAQTGTRVFTDQIIKRAMDVRTFTEGEIEKFEDPLVERIVSKYFAVIDPGTGLQYALSPVATLTLYPGGSPVTVNDPSDCINLLDNPKVIFNTAHLTFHEIEIKDTKKGPRQVRNDLFTFDLNQNVMLWDAGAAVIRGFDVPGFKRTIMKEIHKTKQEMPISFYWSEWLKFLGESVHVFSENVAVVLEIDRTGEFGLVECTGGMTEDTVEVEEVN